MTTHASLIADAALARLRVALPTLKKYRRTPMQQTTPSDLPLVSVYVLREHREALGDHNAGEPHFKNTVTLGIGIQISAAGDNQFVELEEHADTVDRALLQYPSFLAMFEGVVSMDRRSGYSQAGETNLAQTMIEMVVTYQNIFPPDVVDDFLQVGITRTYGTDGQPDPSRPQIVSDDVISQN